MGRTGRRDVGGRAAVGEPGTIPARFSWPEKLWRFGDSEGEVLPPRRDVAGLRVFSRAAHGEQG